MAEVTVLLFARLRDLAGRDSLSIPMSSAARVADVRSALVEVAPAIAELLPRCAVAVNGQYASDDAEIPASAEIAILPPVSGG